MTVGDKLAHHDFGIHQIFGAAETYKSNLQNVYGFRACRDGGR